MKQGIICCLTALACAFASAASVKVDCSKPAGTVRPVNGVGQPPTLGWNNYGMFHYLKEAGIPFSRLHDVGGPFGKNVYVDIPNLFRDFDADPDDPASYDFAFTDKLLEALVKNSIEPFFRLGVTIENSVEVRSYRVAPPKDNLKWAKVCEHVIRHYTEGWANGFRYRITYWEIWNEPENHPDPAHNPMWNGPFESYMKLYGVAAPYLKAKFPHLKIGGYGSCGFYAAANVQAVAAANSSPRTEHFVTCFTNFLAQAKANAWPLDFFSFHSYSMPAEALRQVAWCRETLDASGFKDTEMSFNEWLPSPNLQSRGTMRQAALIAAELIGLQNGPCATAMIYDARCGGGNYSPLFNPLTETPHKAYWDYVAFNELRKLGTAVACACDDGEVYACAAAKDGALAVMIANISGKNVPLTLDLGDGKVASCRVIDASRTWEKVPLPPVLAPDTVLLVSAVREDNRAVSGK